MSDSWLVGGEPGDTFADAIGVLLARCAGTATTLPILKEWRRAFEQHFALKFERCERLRKQHALAYRAVGPPPPAEPARPLPPLPIARDTKPAVGPTQKSQ